MTEKLYYHDAYINDFTAKVISCEPYKDGYLTVLDKTALFPEEGGQYSDTGTIGESTVKRVFEKDGIVYHITDKECKAGESVACFLNFEERYDKMQCHTAEHILSGLFHSLFGCENVGFHLGAEEVTMDINSPLTESDIIKVEELANKVIYENVPVTAYFPTKEELFTLKYRSKLELFENIRIVKIGKYDSCACCAPHVASTGEVGVIKILDFMKHRGGTRLFITAGFRAFMDYRRRYESVREISRMLSVPKEDVSSGVSALFSENESLKLALKSAREELFLKYASEIDYTDGNLVVHLDGAGIEEARAFANAIDGKVSGMAVILFGKGPDFKYLITSKTVNLKVAAPQINQALLGRGGGKTDAIQGSFSTELSKIKAYFA